MTFVELFERFIDEYAKPNRKTWKTDSQRLIPTGEHDERKRDSAICRLHALRPNELKRHDLEREIEIVHGQLSAKTPVEANRVAQTVSRVINWGAKYRLVPREFHNILEFVDLNKEAARATYIRAAELPAFADALRYDRFLPSSGSTPGMVDATGLCGCCSGGAAWLKPGATRVTVGGSEGSTTRPDEVSLQAIDSRTDRVQSRVRRSGYFPTRSSCDDDSPRPAR